MFFCVILKTDANIVNIPLWCLVSTIFLRIFNFLSLFLPLFRIICVILQRFGGEIPSRRCISFYFALTENVWKTNLE